MKDKCLFVFTCLLTILTLTLTACSNANAKIIPIPVSTTQTQSQTQPTLVSDPDSLVIFRNQSIEALLTDSGYEVVPTVLRAYGGNPSSGGYHWSLPADSQFPSGISVDTAGRVTYTGDKTMQASSFTMTATDGTLTAQATFLVNIEDYRGGPLPVIGLMQSARELPAARSGAPYGATVSAWGGTPPYTFAIDASGTSSDFARSGLHIDAATGVIYGTVSPQVAGQTLHFEILLTDSTDHTNDDPKAYTIQVLP